MVMFIGSENVVGIYTDYDPPTLSTPSSVVR